MAGKLRFVFPFIQLTPTMFETKYTNGDFWFGSMLLVVTRGLGMSLAPIRYNSTPEVTLITLRINNKCAMLTLSEINIYPIKSLGGISLQSSVVEERGLKYDRSWVLVDESNKFFTQRDFPKWH